MKDTFADINYSVKSDTLNQWKSSVRLFISNEFYNQQILHQVFYERHDPNELYWSYLRFSDNQ